MNKTLGIITFAQSHIKVDGLLENRPTGAFSFLGRYRVIDFPISNFSNSGIDQIHVYLNKNPRSLTEHIGDGRQYNINSKKGQLRLLYADNKKGNDLYNTNINAYREHLEFIEEANAQYVIITPAYMVFTQDFDALLETHKASGADISLLYHKVNNAKDVCLSCDVLSFNKQKGVLGITRNPATADDADVFMDTFVMTKDLFIDIIKRTESTSAIYTITDMVNDLTNELDIRGIEHEGYFATVTDFKSYYQANIELADLKVAETLITPDWPIYTMTSDSCPAMYFKGGKATYSCIANGCKISGKVENSVLSRGVTVGLGAVVKNCVIGSDVVIGEGIHIENMVVDRNAKVITAKEIIAPEGQPGFINKFDVV